jgi:uncharacterized protein Yka (UPF0111/DUF47 family)
MTKRYVLTVEEVASIEKELDDIAREVAEHVFHCQQTESQPDPVFLQEQLTRCENLAERLFFEVELPRGINRPYAN